MSAGQSVLVRFPDDDQPELWQERVLLASSGRRRWVVLSPDSEMDELALDDFTFRPMGSDRSLPVGISEEDCYLVYFDNRPRTQGFYSKAGLKNCLAEGAAMAAILQGDQEDEAEILAKAPRA